MLFFKKKKKNSLDLNKFLREISRLKKQKISLKSFEYLDEILRSYLFKKYNLKRNLTLNELLKKLEKMRIKNENKIILSRLLLEIYQGQYKSEKLPSKNEFENLLKNSRKVLRLLD